MGGVVIVGWGLWVVWEGWYQVLSVSVYEPVHHSAPPSLPLLSYQARLWDSSVSSTNVCVCVCEIQQS